jgi:hypothetical protein
MSPNAADHTATITITDLDQIVVCLRCYAELRSWRAETIEAFKAWHTERCGGDA